MRYFWTDGTAKLFYRLTDLKIAGKFPGKHSRVFQRNAL